MPGKAVFGKEPWGYLGVGASSLGRRGKCSGEENVFRECPGVQHGSVRVIEEKQAGMQRWRERGQVAGFSGFEANVMTGLYSKKNGKPLADLNRVVI